MATSWSVQNTFNLNKLWIASLVAFIISLGLPFKDANAQKKKIPTDPVQIVDSSTGAAISKVLIVPRYSYAAGVMFAPEGRGNVSKYGNYVDKPFIYSAPDELKIKRPKPFIGLPLYPIMIGKGKEIDGILVVAKNYTPKYITDLWTISSQGPRTISLTPIDNREWSEIGEKLLKPLYTSTVITDNCQLWGVSDDKCKIKVKFSRKEQRVVREFFDAGS